MPLPIQNVSMTAPQYQAELGDIERKRRLAEALQSQSMQEIPQTTAGGWTVPISPFQGLAKMLQAYAGSKGMQDATDREKRLSEALMGQRKADSERFVQMLTGAPERQLPDDGSGLGSVSMPAVQANPEAAYSFAATNDDPTMRALGIQGIQNLNKPMVVGRSLVSPQGKTLATDSTWQQEQDAARQAKADADRQKADEARQKLISEQAFRDQQARQAALDRENLVRVMAGQRQPNNPIAVIGPDGKPRYVAAQDAVGQQPWDRRAGAVLPPAALKIQQELLEEIGTSSAISNDLGAIGNQISGGGLSLGPVNNTLNAARNAVGLSTDQSKNYASFKSTLERLRNDSLRLNKGVQTEGDAVRAWNELISSTNDPGVVQQRIDEIRRINERAVALKRMQIDQVRSNYGLDPIETSGFTNQPPAVGQGSGPNAQAIADELRRRGVIK